MQPSEKGRGLVGAPREALRSPTLVRCRVEWLAILFVVCLNSAAAAQAVAVSANLYRIIDGKVGAGTYTRYRRYHAVCNHCHGPDGMGTSFGPLLVDHLPDIEIFRRIVRDGQSRGTAVMNGFREDPNVAPYVTTSTHIPRRAPMANSAAAVRSGWANSEDEGAPANGTKLGRCQGRFSRSAGFRCPCSEPFRHYSSPATRSPWI
jgi:mono/diheme cytochrome c family protein